MDKMQNVQCARETQKPLKMQVPTAKILHCAMRKMLPLETLKQKLETFQPGSYSFPKSKYSQTLLPSLPAPGTSFHLTTLARLR